MDSYPVHILKTLGMFLVTGDPNPRHDVSALPLLGPVLVVPFLLGIWHCWRRRDDHGHALVLLGLPVFLIPPLIANEGGAPHFLRSLGLEPYVAACIGLGCLEGISIAPAACLGYLLGSERSVTQTGWIVCAIAVTALGVASVATYLNRPVADRYAAFTFADVALANAAVNNSTDGGPSTLVILDSYDAMDVQFLDAGRAAHHRRADDQDRERGRVLADRRPVASRHRGRRRRRASPRRLGSGRPIRRAIPWSSTWCPRRGCRRCPDPARRASLADAGSMVGSMLRGYSGKDLADHRASGSLLALPCSGISRSGETRPSPRWRCSDRSAR